TEMTLSGVKVMRNDLSDADLELVRKPATKENPFSGATPLPSVDMDPAQKKPGLIQKIIGRVRGAGRSSE
ncbi:MAG TPA: hypothetical protein VK968_19910, partial [Roseimicrobium sp.]|nr:hypothetical protein [Roseimicrobium sp.]